jgi:RNA polymerase sigma factor (sigma-70 family)
MDPATGPQRTAMRDDPVVMTLVARACDGDQHAWNEIVDRYAPLVWSICKRNELSRHDIDDVSQTVWLLLVEQLGNLRQPTALAGWLATTTNRECQRIVRAATRYDLARSPGDSSAPGDQPPAMIDQEVIAEEQRAALRAAFAELPARCRKLLSLLLSEPPIPHAEISARLLIPIESIGPQRGRCLNRLRRSASLAAFTFSDLQASVAGSASSRDTGGVQSA